MAQKRCTPERSSGVMVMTAGPACARLRSGRFLVLLVVIDLGEFRIDDVLLLGAAGTIAGCRATRAAGRRGTLLRLLVHRLAELHGSLCKRIGLGRDRTRII